MKYKGEVYMDIGLIGLGKMGLNLALNMLDHEYGVIAYDPHVEKTTEETYKVIHYKDSLKSVVKSLTPPRVIWMMVPSGETTDSVIDELKTVLSAGDIVIDGGNSNYKDSMTHAKSLSAEGIELLDVGTSGGQAGAREGACFMIGGSQLAFDYVKPLFKAIAQKDGYAYMGKSGSGHYVKMIHNGIEYGMMQAIGEGFDLLKASPFDLDYHAISNVWANGSIIEGHLMNMVVGAFEKDGTLSSIKGRVDDSCEGRWAIEEALDLNVSIPVITQALFSRYKSKDDDRFAERVIAAIRNEFGGHKVYKKE
jgi:6-phosphogluconate dehydrogenase